MAPRAAVQEKKAAFLVTLKVLPSKYSSTGAIIPKFSYSKSLSTICEAPPPRIFSPLNGQTHVCNSDITHQPSPTLNPESSYEKSAVT